MTQYYSTLLLIPFLGGLVLAFVLLRPATRKILPTFAVAMAALAIPMGVGYSVSSRGRAVIVSTGFRNALPEALWFGLTVGVFTAAFFLLLGYIYGDAKRRQMPAVAWVIAALFIPNLVGVILYFLFRRPLLEPCRHCGKPIRAGEAFCSLCGSPQATMT
jgi:hypothetical protein